MEDQTITTNKTNSSSGQNRLKVGLGLAISLLIPPIGLVIGLWLLFKAGKLHQRQLKVWGFTAIALALIGAAGYGLFYSNYKERQSRIYPSEYSQEAITVCLDSKQTLYITKDKPYVFNLGVQSDTDPSQIPSVSGQISLTLVRHLLEKTNGDFVIGVGPDKGTHHFDEGKCPES